MIPEKITIFVLLVLSTIYTSESANDLRTGFDGNSVCFKSSGPLDIKVPDIIQPSQGLERLVLFLYRDVITNQINVHTPSLETQRDIPDLPFCNNDELTQISTETISAIVNRSPHKIYIQASRPEFNGGHITDFDFNSDIESLDNYNKFTDNRLSNYINVNQIDEQRFRHIPAIESQENRDKWKHNFPSNYINVNQIDDAERHEHFTPDIESQENNDKWKFSIPSNHINVNKIDYQRHKDVIPDTEYQENYKWKNNAPSKYVNLNQINDQQHRDSIISAHPQVIPADVQVFPIYRQMISDNRQVIPENAPVMSAHPWQVQGQFSEWILEQIETFDNHKHRGQKNIDLTAIGNSILRILYKNGMHVTDKGELMDFYGTLLDMHTLSLRPIFVANTVPLDNLLNRPGELISSQGTLPHIQAILLTTTQLPFKILGVIPLGEANLPISTHSTLTSIWKDKPENVVTKKSYVQIPNIQSIPPNFEIENLDENNSKEVNNLEKGKQGIETGIYDAIQDPRSKPKNGNQTKQQYKNNKITNREQKDGQTEYENRDKIYMPVNSSIYINVNGDENSLDRSDLDQHLNLFSSIRGVKSEDDPIDRQFSNSLKIDLSSLDQAKRIANIASLFLPKIATLDYPVDISSKSQVKTVDNVPNRQRNSASIHIPGLMSDPLEILFKREYEPVTNVGKHNHDAMETPSFVTHSNGDSISSVVVKDSNPKEILKKWSLINMKGVAKPSDSSGIQTTPSMPYEENWKGDQMLYNFVNKQGKSKSRIENVPGLVNPAQQGFKSIGGLAVPEIVGSNNYEQVTTPPVRDDGEDDYDDYDAEIRIIGGNAATGSGTPLNNRGRSGFVI